MKHNTTEDGLEIGDNSQRIGNIYVVQQKSPKLSPRLSPKSQGKGVDLNSPEAVFPVLVQDKLTKQKLQTQRSGSKKFEEEVEETVAEEKEENENERHFLKKIPIFADAQEFNVKQSYVDRFRGRQYELGENVRTRSLDANHLPLAKVQEAKVEEDETQRKDSRKAIDIFRDKNEFNLDVKKLQPRRYSLIPEGTEPIIEEIKLEKKSTFHKMQSPLTGSRGRSHNKELKVDEVDVKPRKPQEPTDESDEEETPIEPIAEEEAKESVEVESSREYQSAKHKLQEEKDFIKRVIEYKGEQIGEEDAVRREIINENEIPSVVNDPIQEEITEEDKGESPSLH